MVRGGTNAWRIRNIYVANLKGGGTVTCGLCLKAIKRLEDLTIDHIIPKVAGGKGDTSNLQPAHYKCNQQKGERILALPQLESKKQ